MTAEDKYLEYIASVKRYSPRTRQIYADIIHGFSEFAPDADVPDVSLLRGYEVHLMEDRKAGARTVSQHISVLSGYCRFLMKEGLLKSNPAKLVAKPKEEKRLPVFYREESMREYFRATDFYVSEEYLDVIRGSSDTKAYENLLRRIVVSILYSTGIRRAELIGLKRNSVDLGRKILKVHGKGDKMRDVPLTDSLCKEISLYLTVQNVIVGTDSAEMPLLCTPKGGSLYPMWVDRAIKKELGSVKGITGRKSPHVLRHTLASELLENGTDLNSIKELLGHSSLAATQVYTHTTIERLRDVYENAHPRAKNGGKNGN